MHISVYVVAVFSACKMSGIFHFVIVSLYLIVIFAQCKIYSKAIHTIVLYALVLITLCGMMRSMLYFKYIMFDTCSVTNVQINFTN